MIEKLEDKKVSRISSMYKNQATGKYIKISPYKVSRVLDQIRGKNFKEAQLILEFMPYKACKIIKKLLESAASNTAKNTEQQINTLIVKQAYVNKGPTLKRFQPRAQGRAFPIHKPTCHITITLDNV